MSGAPTILLVEDNEDDVFLMTRALKLAGISNPLALAEDGQEAMNYLAGKGRFSDRQSNPLPFVIFLDLKLPFVSGLEVLAWARGEPSLSSVVIVILSSSEEPSDLRRAKELGANYYLVKPPTTSILLGLAEKLKLNWLLRDK